jgi:hypothetical protein
VDSWDLREPILAVFPFDILEGAEHRSQWAALSSLQSTSKKMVATKPVM